MLQSGDGQGHGKSHRRPQLNGFQFCGTVLSKTLCCIYRELKPALPLWDFHCFHVPSSLPKLTPYFQFQDFTLPWKIVSSVLNPGWRLTRSDLQHGEQRN